MCGSHHPYNFSKSFGNCSCPDWVDQIHVRTFTGKRPDVESRTLSLHIYEKRLSGFAGQTLLAGGRIVCGTRHPALRLACGGGRPLTVPYAMHLRMGAPQVLHMP